MSQKTNVKKLPIDHEAIERMVRDFEDNYFIPHKADRKEASNWLRTLLTQLHTEREEAVDKAYKRGLEQSQEVLDDMMAEARREERERCVGIVGNVLSIKPTPTQLFTTIASEINNSELQREKSAAPAKTDKTTEV